jgi:hypothetical protein
MNEVYWHLADFARAYWDVDRLGCIPDNISELIARFAEWLDLDWCIQPVEAPWLEERAGHQPAPPVVGDKLCTLPEPHP